MMANSHAKCGAASHVTPRHLLLPQNRKKRANTRFSTKNTHEIPEMPAVIEEFPKKTSNKTKKESK